MKHSFALAILVASVPLLWTADALGQDSADEPAPILATAKLKCERAQVARPGLRVSAGPDPDTVYVGYSQTDHWSATDNYWNIWSGTRRPGTNDANNATWDWDNLGILAAHGVGDSLAGWWPDLRLYNSTGGYTLPDDQRPWWAVEQGNRANYVPNQGAGGKRTYGVVGVWHGDGGVRDTLVGGSAVLWEPLAGNRSAWCGLRQLNDHSNVDAVTGSPFNQSVVERVSGGGNAFAGSPRTYPGYANQWDQMLYRDIAASPGTPLNISFLYRTRMSTGIVTAAATRTGWFHGDPLAVVAGNFISSSAAGTNAPRDSFSVYVGAPVDVENCTYSDGSVGAVYDVQRRWFSEVLRIFDGSPYYCLFSVAGNNPADTAAATPTANLTLPAAQVDAIRAVSGGVVRIVFRSHTNRGYSDDDGGASNSFSRGAALLDDVTVNGNNIGDFELAEQGGINAIDNRVTASSLNFWKSTGKPPSTYAHLGNLEAGIPYIEMCGAWDSPARHCDIHGNVLMMGNYDAFEAMNDPRYPAYREGFPGAWSPTVNTTVDRSGANAVNPHGLTESVVTTTGADGGLYLLFDIFGGQLNLTFTGVAFWPAWQVYPVRQPHNGAMVWTDPLTRSIVYYWPDRTCFGYWYNLDAEVGRPAVANAYDVPDSVRVWVGIYQACFRWNVTLGCNDNDGVYFDNISLAFVESPSALRASDANAIEPGLLTAWEPLPADVFPANESPALPNSSNFDTTTALIKGPTNAAQTTPGYPQFCIQPDTIIITAPNVSGDVVLGNATRLDLVFRILPGPGNYAITSPGGRTFPPTATMQLLDVPTDQSSFVSSGDGTFWGEYIASAGAFSAGDHHGGTRWDYLTWNSARCDTADKNALPVAGTLSSGLAPGKYANMLHEEDPKFATLGIPKFRCFMVDTAGVAANANIVCDGTIPAWLTAVPQSRTGWDGVATTKEFTKIIPDGLLTPGAHVQYFFRKSAMADPAACALVPDTLNVFTWGEWNLDAHRWQQFGVLPDRWKDPAFGGAGMACMLYVDLCDGVGAEPVFVSVMDSLGGTAPAKYGAHNGWHAPAMPGPLGIEDLAAFPVYGRNQQPGTTWDMYGIRAYSSIGAALGNRLANRAAMGYATGKQAMTGPTPEMLRRFYRLLTMLTGALPIGILGPGAHGSRDDIGILNDFLTGTDVGSTTQPRGVFAGGDGFAEGEMVMNVQDASHLLFLTTKLGLSLRNPSYQAVSGNPNDCADLITTSAITTNGDVYGVGTDCLQSNDLLQRNPALAETQDAAYYENVGVNGPYVAAVYKPAVPARNWVAYTEGWDIARLWGRYCETSGGRLAYYWNMYNAIFATQCQVTTTAPSLTLDVPQSGQGAPFTNFMKVGNSVARAGEARIHFGLASADRVRIRLYDVAGRRVRTLADRSFKAGEYELAWDGADDRGGAVARGVYFARLEYATKGAAINNRVVILR